ncbi:ATP-binding protein [Paenibacillus alkaliterrae]|uniref:ATP-binding protein n=1 Tax=Paenibacillus alkaliterrae TaxID=320909 RepID=UPI001F2FB7F4|nr:ATP-binding protein [Paenibacillus alkaliterrae]MCF2941539.1 ATP-binding protein [Paenibacillus alkaliterrae]
MDRDGRLSISSERSADSVLIKIKDTGQGMSPEVVKGLFIPFFTRKENGTGLGLVVCKRILDSCGGCLLIDSQEGAGTEITIQIPLVLI